MTTFTRRFALGLRFWLLTTIAVTQTNARIGMVATTLDDSNFDDFIHKNTKVLVDFYDDEHRNDKELEAAIISMRNLGSMVSFAKVDASSPGAAKLISRFSIGKALLPLLMWFVHGEATQYHRSLRTAKSIQDFLLALDREPIVAVESEAALRDYNRCVFLQMPRTSPLFDLAKVVASKHMDTVAFLHKVSTQVSFEWVEDGKERIAYTEEVTLDALDKWIKAMLIRSEPIPDHQEGDSYIVVGSTFEEVVLQRDKDVFLNIYAPWCGFSRQFLPIWNRFAREVAHVQHLVVAKMDGEANGSPLPEFTWNSYPTVFFVKAGSREPILYRGNRTVESLAEFATQQGSKLLNLLKPGAGVANEDTVIEL